MSKEPRAPARKDVDRRVRKTKTELRDALIALVLERGWDKVSVKEVCDRADVGRSTFYVHFVDKEDLLLSGFDDLHRALREHHASAGTPFAFAEALISHARDNIKLYRALIGRKSGQAVQRRFRDTMAKVVDSELETYGVSAADRPLTTQFVAGGFAEMILGWLDRPSRIESGALAASFRAFALGAVSSLRKGS